MRYKLFLFIGFLSFIAIGSTIIFYTSQNYKVILNVQKENKIVVHINGAIENQGTFFLKPKSTLKNLIDKSILLPYANIENLELDQELKNNQKIFISYDKDKIKKINLAEITDVLQLKKWGILTNQSHKIFNYVQTNDQATLKDIENIKGVGKTSIEILKLFINN